MGWGSWGSWGLSEEPAGETACAAGLALAAKPCPALRGRASFALTEASVSPQTSSDHGVWAGTGVGRHALREGETVRTEARRHPAGPGGLPAAAVRPAQLPGGQVPSPQSGRGHGGGSPHVTPKAQGAASLRATAGGAEPPGTPDRPVGHRDEVLALLSHPAPLTPPPGPVWGGVAGGPGGHRHVALSGPAAGSHLGAAAPGGHPRAPAARGRGRGGPFRSLCLRLAGHRAPRCSPTWAKQRARTRSGSRRWPRVSGGCGEAARPSRGSGSPGVWRRLAGSTAAGWERGPGQGLPRPQAGGRPQEALRAAAGQRPGWAAERSRRPPLLADPVAPPVCVGGRDDV